MSYGITPIAVDLAKIRSAFGSKDHGLFESLCNEFSWRLTNLDRNDEEGEETVPASKALRQMIMGEEYCSSWWVAFKYGYGLLFLCQHFGEGLPNDEWTAMRGEWAKTVDQALAEAGLAEDCFRVVSYLMSRGAPVSIPAPDDFPAIGYLHKHEIPNAQKALAEAMLRIQDREISASLRQILLWLEKCSEGGTDLVCFYY